MGARLANFLRLPPGLEWRVLENSPGRLHIVVLGRFRWDAGQESDAVTMVALLFGALRDAIGGTSAVDFQRARALPPVQAISPSRRRSPAWPLGANAKLFGAAIIVLREISTSPSARNAPGNGYRRSRGWW